LSEKIPTVGIVTWSVDQGPLTSASIEFGRDGAVEYQAPVDLNEPGYRTLLLGMKPATTYTFRIIAVTANGAYRSEAYTLATGARGTGLPLVSVTDATSGPLAGGFIVTCSFSNGWTYILDKDGDFVWWFKPQGGKDLARARMTYDGRHMVSANGNVPGPNKGTLSKVSMDGSDEQTFDVAQRHHDIEVLPDGSVVYLEYEATGTGTCDRVVQLAPDGTKTQLFLVRDHFAQRATSTEWCHSNAINYVPAEDAFTLSILDLGTIVKFTVAGELVWRFGGADTDFPGASWDKQHQHHWLGESLLLFTNYGDGGGGFVVTSRVLEYSVNELTREAGVIWQYESDGAGTMSLGDAKRLPNGNTLVGFSNDGAIHEVSPSGETLRRITTAQDSQGYLDWRASLYGPPQSYRE